MTGVKRDLVERVTDFVHHGKQNTFKKILDKIDEVLFHDVQIAKHAYRASLVSQVFFGEGVKKGPFLKKMAGGWACPGNYDPVRRTKIPCDFYEIQIERPALRMPDK